MKNNQKILRFEHKIITKYKQLREFVSFWQF